MVAAKSNMGVDLDSLPWHLSCIDVIDARINEFNTAYIKLSDRSNQNTDP